MTSPDASRSIRHPAALPAQPMARHRRSGRSSSPSLAGGAMGFSYLFLRDPAPAAVGLSNASPTPTAASARPASADPAASAPAATSSSSTTGIGLDGTWSVDPSVGSFCDFSGSFVGYRVEEELANGRRRHGRRPDARRHRQPHPCRQPDHCRRDERRPLHAPERQVTSATGSSGARPSKRISFRPRRSSSPSRSISARCRPTAR